ncbi:molecular chaperone, partial [Actinomyces sp. HMSC075C01]
DSGLCFLEVKTNGSREATVKDRFKYDPDDADRITPDGHLFVIERLVESGTCTPDEARTIADALVPVMDSTYSRTTLHLPHDEARATFDTQLTWDLFGPDGKRLERGVSVGHLNVVETKNPSTASPTDRLLWHQGHRPARISKYATGMALLHGKLPTNRWNRTIKRDLGRYWRQVQSRQLAA